MAQPVTPVEVDKVMFTSRGIILKGYDETEVDDFLDQVSQTLSSHHNLLDDLKKRNAVLYRYLVNKHFGFDNKVL